MKLIYPHDVPRMGVVRTFRHSRLSPLTLFIAVAGGTAWWTIAMPLSQNGRPIHWLPTLLGLVMCLVVLIYVAKSLKPTNWLMKVTEDGLFIKFRSYLNEKLPETGPLVLHVPYAEIERVSAGRRKLTLPDRDGRVTTNQLRYLDIDLRHEATGDVAEALKAERRVRPIRNGAAKHHDYPLRVTAPNRLRLDWKVTPGTEAVLETLHRFVSVEHEEQRVTLDWERMDRASREAMVVELAELGERMRARHLAEALYGLDKAEARAYVDEIVGRDKDKDGR